MATARQRAEWQRAASLMCVVASAAPFGKRGKRFKPDDFMPEQLRATPQRAARVRAERVPITALRDVFIRGQLPTIENGEGPS